MTFGPCAPGQVAVHTEHSATQHAGEVRALRDHLALRVRGERSSPPPKPRPGWRSKTCSVLPNCAHRTLFPRPKPRQGKRQAYARLTAPHAGVVTAISVEAGQVVVADQPVAVMGGLIAATFLTLLF
jgi:acetyl/propionyl-CoA carboxylase alpha subunit